jgi:hypothetical protein
LKMPCHAKRLERPACWRCRKSWGGSKTGASSKHSKRFAQLGYLFAAGRLCADPPRPDGGLSLRLEEPVKAFGPQPA